MLDPSSLLLLLSCKQQQQRIKTRILASQKTDFPQLVIFHLSLGKSSRNRDLKKNPSNMENWSFYNTSLSLFQWLD
jgi:hypothetical protein